MTKEEMKQRIAELERENEERKRFVFDLYAQTAAKFKRGEIIADGSDMIVVDGFSYSRMADDICYRGAALTAKGTPRRDGAQRYIYESRAHKITFHEKKS